MVCSLTFSMLYLFSLYFSIDLLLLKTSWLFYVFMIDD